MSYPGNKRIRYSSNVGFEYMRPVWLLLVCVGRARYCVTSFDVPVVLLMNIYVYLCLMKSKSRLHQRYQIRGGSCVHLHTVPHFKRNVDYTYKIAFNTFRLGLRVKALLREVDLGKQV